MIQTSPEWAEGSDAVRWELAEEQVVFQESLRAWLAKAASSASVRGWLDMGDPFGFETQLVADGWLAVGAAEERGGQGGGLPELVLTAEELARRAAPSAAWMASVLALPALPDDVSSEVLVTGGFAALVVDASRPFDGPPRFQLDEDGTLSGAASTVLGGDRATRLVVPVRTSGGTDLYLVDAAGAGVTVTGRELLDRTRSVADIILVRACGVRLDVEAQEVLEEAALRCAVLLAADSLGAMERMLELTVEYSKQRQQFGVPIASFQAVKHAAATMLVAVESSRSIVYFAAASVDQKGEERGLHAAVAKAQVTAAGVQAADSALTLHGAIGYTWEHDLHLLYKRAKLDERLSGSPSVWNERIADALPLLPVA
jgi:alkylation response protein AidB-like acyl-CoA dehydrogenase